MSQRKFVKHQCAEIMDASRLLILIFVVMSTFECSGSDTAELQCEVNSETIYLVEGEALYFVHEAPAESTLSNQTLKWYKNNSRIEYISYDEKERIHLHGGAIFFLNVVPGDSGLYTARLERQNGECNNYIVEVKVFEASERENHKLLYGEIKDSDQNKNVECPDRAKETCIKFGGNYTWYKDYSLLQGHHKDNMWIQNSSKQDEGVYTCICTWRHNDRLYNTSGSRRLYVLDTKSYPDVEILSPLNKEQFADESLELKLNCTVECGRNVKDVCTASWYVNGNQVNQMAGYNQTIKQIMEMPSKTTITTAILTIKKVSAKDFRAEFKCRGIGSYTAKSATLTLKRRASITSLVIRAVCVLLVCVFAAVLVKCFAVDLALLFRPCFHLRSHEKDARMYDAYVVYQMQKMDKVTENTLCQFITQVLPSVLEEKCGYRLFIQGRDDIPGEDHMELVENNMKQSRRLMVILTPGSGSGCEMTDQHPDSLCDSVIGGFDWQVGLHHALVQREMSVILIQLGDTGPQGYTHLPIGLQHLIRKSAPIRWPDVSRNAAARNSRFWKRVRYLMPATPAKRCPQSALI
ncbi:interleukin-1 receptor-like 1 isoform X1 [Pleuronectes platessa]|uniref:interleukin-1 receptor-like 1 isoform X1 n=2 Tax=Pleuronectes platessa TaxID=8262 RepID=UPI00232A4FE9|nr:interleukin-1 receptor-like 1 isoform X1 [Pleuronectes platessa]XP_053295659.1 interleukin-1 receptor-like 1 isoform X1 [Pleuronectes platessa]XP_053295660.1 interleukin-1 receptor-like 1 isoform X1 [Pleuronectes platessa]